LIQEGSRAVSLGRRPVRTGSAGASSSTGSHGARALWPGPLPCRRGGGAATERRGSRGPEGRAPPAGRASAVPGRGGAVWQERFHRLFQRRLRWRLGVRAPGRGLSAGRTERLPQAVRQLRGRQRSRDRLLRGRADVLWQGGAAVPRVGRRVLPVLHPCRHRCNRNDDVDDHPVVDDDDHFDRPRLHAAVWHLLWRHGPGVQLQLLRRLLPGHHVREDLQSPERSLLFPGPVHLPVVRSLRYQSESRCEREHLRMDGGQWPGRQGRRLPQLRPVRGGLPQGESERQLQGLGSSRAVSHIRCGLAVRFQIHAGGCRASGFSMPGRSCQDAPHQYCSCTART